MLFKGYFKAAMVLSFTLMGSAATISKPANAAQKVACQMDSKGACPCRDAAERKLKDELV